MPYVRPDYDAADASFAGASAYSLPVFSAANVTFSTEAPQSLASADSPLGEASLLAQVSMTALAAADSPLGEANLLGAMYNAVIAANSPLGSPGLFARVDVAFVAADSPLGGPALFAFSDVASAVELLQTTHYTADLTTPGGVVRFPISSWSASLEVEKSSYLGCVIPGADDDALVIIQSATSLALVRYAYLPGGDAMEILIAEGDITAVQADRGPTNSTASVTAYTGADAYPAPPDGDPDPQYDRALTGIRSTSVYASGTRVRCAIDWLLKPGQRATYFGTELVASRIAYQASVVDAYMDVTEVIDQL